jgi:hypothetical protein
MEGCELCWRPIRHVECQPYLRPTIHCDVPTLTCTLRASKSLEYFSEPRASSNLMSLLESRYRISFIGSIYENYFIKRSN